MVSRCLATKSNPATPPDAPARASDRNGNATAAVEPVDWRTSCKANQYTPTITVEVARKSSLNGLDGVTRIAMSITSWGAPKKNPVKINKNGSESQLTSSGNPNTMHVMPRQATQRSAPIAAEMSQRCSTIVIAYHKMPVRASTHRRYGPCTHLRPSCRQKRGSTPSRFDNTRQLARAPSIVSASKK